MKCEHSRSERDCCKFDRVAVGEYEWTARIVSNGSEEDRPYRVYKKKLTIRARETVDCVFTEADRVEEK